MNIETAIFNYENSVKILIDLFAQKQDRDIEYDVNSLWCEIDNFYMTPFSDILLDLKTKQPKGFVFEWYNSKEHQEDNVNYQSYINGLRK